MRVTLLACSNFSFFNSKTIGSIAIGLTAFVLTSAAAADDSADAGKESRMVPLELRCAYESREIPGLDNKKETTVKTVKIAPPLDTPAAMVLVEKVGQYELWVNAHRVLEGGPKDPRVEILDYRAEIRDTKTGFVSQALSDSTTGRPRSKSIIKRARVALVRYGSAGSKVERLEVASLRFSCHHVPGADGPDRLKLRAGTED
jgi:hypothetical protein